MSVTEWKFVVGCTRFERSTFGEGTAASVGGYAKTIGSQARHCTTATPRLSGERNEMSRKERKEMEAECGLFGEVGVYLVVD